MSIDFTVLGNDLLRSDSFSQYRRRLRSDFLFNQFHEEIRLENSYEFLSFLYNQQIQLHSGLIQSVLQIQSILLACILFVSVIVNKTLCVNTLGLTVLFHG